jgi:dTDP-4-dehydrorhamnose 3,5-epimerase
MKVIRTELDGVLILEPEVYRDSRGYFFESYQLKSFQKSTGMNYQWVQDNQSFSEREGTIRGLHWQIQPMAQAKIVRVMTGAVLDVVVDLRKESPKYKKWISVELTAQNFRQVLIPKGFAHGFCTLQKDTIVLYKVDNVYSSEHDRGMIWNDPDLNISWPTSTPILSEKDSKLPMLKKAEVRF